MGKKYLDTKKNSLEEACSKNIWNGRLQLHESTR